MSTTIVGPHAGPRPDRYFDDRATGERIVVTVSCALVGVTFIARCVGRYALKLRNDREMGGARGWLGLDDVLNFVAVCTFYALAISILISVERGLGRHISAVVWDHGSSAVGRYQLGIYVCALTYNTVLGCVKLSVLALYRRILAGVPSRKLSIINWIVAAVVLANTIINVFVAAFQCDPVAAAFHTIEGAKCINTSAFYIGNAITGIITDLMVYCLCIPIVKPLQMQETQKYFTMVTLLFGLFAVITSAVRLSFLPALLKDPDISWAMAIPMDWSIVEPAVGILVSSAPAIVSVRYLWARNFGRSSKNTTFPSHNDVNDRSTRGRVELQSFGKDDEKTTSFIKVIQDDDSEKNLIYQDLDMNNGAIHKKTDVTVTRD